uniref:Reverse transcriptase domain-containing protein n=1 Tax=Nicotiana tabacum TaxID=4097 RepID=A0A1S4DE20_TOBAC|nr:PREDICTED: uncharacterized protein LOC107828812 [Nicotiana tabacum]
MEYLNKSLKQLKSNPVFNYHPKCAKLGVVHICFADDLLMCCRADKVSIELMMKQFENFSVASGLQANMEKSSLYVAGISTQYKQEILEKLKGQMLDCQMFIICRESSANQKNFLWHGSIKGKKAPIAWDTICKPRAAGD